MFESFHTCAVVADLEEAMERLGVLFSGGWVKRQEAAVPVTHRGVTQAVPVRFVYSAPPGPQLELVEAVDGTVWGPEAVGYHHTEYWVADLAAASDLLESRGYRLEAAGGAGDDPVFTYHLSPAGERIELVSDVVRPAFTRWMNGGDYIS